MGARVQISCAGPWHYRFGLCLIDLILATLNARSGGSAPVDDLYVHHKMGSILPQLRHHAVREAFRRGASHIFFVDSDQTFPSTALIQLLSHRLPVVGANVATKTVPANPTARRRGSKPAGELVFTGPESPMVEPVWRLGFGVTLIETEVFRQIPEPWFAIEYRKEIDDYMGEDWFFFEKAERYGIRPYVDHLVSADVGHVGDYTYTHADTHAPGGMLDQLIPKLMSHYKKGGVHAA